MTDQTLPHAEPVTEAAPIALARACVFECGGALFGVAVSEVREVAELSQITLLPRLPSHVWGVANLRGVMVPVLDPASALGLTAAVPRTATSAVLIKDGREEVGLAVDRVHGLIPMEERQPAGPAAADPVARFATEVFRLEDRWVMLLDGLALVAALRPPRVRTPELV